MEWTTVMLAVTGLLLFFLVIGVPVGISLPLASLPFLLGALGWQKSLAVVGEQYFSAWSNYPLLALPLFVFMGEVLFASGIGPDLFTVASKWMGGLRGSLGLATIGSLAVFGALSGSSVGATFLFAKLSIPQMLKRGYHKGLATGCVAAGGGLVHIIPPSGFGIIYAVLVDASVPEMLMAGLVPGLMLAGLFALVIVIWTAVSPDAAPREPSASWRDKLVALARMGAPLAIIAAVLGAIFSGMTTIIEAAAAGGFASLLVALVTRRLTWEGLVNSATGVAKTAGFVMLIIGGASIFSWVLAYYLIPQHIVEIVVATGWAPLGIVAMLQLMYIILGMFLTPTAMIVITVPIIQPLLLALDMSPIWFGVMLLINIEMAQVTPPVGVALYIIRGVVPKEVTLTDIVKGSIPFLVADVVAIALVLFFPQLALWVPEMMRGI